MSSPSRWPRGVASQFGVVLLTLGGPACGGEREGEDAPGEKPTSPATSTCEYEPLDLAAETAFLLGHPSVAGLPAQVTVVEPITGEEWAPNNVADGRYLTLAGHHDVWVWGSAEDRSLFVNLRVAPNAAIAGETVVDLAVQTVTITGTALVDEGKRDLRLKFSRTDGSGYFEVDATPGADGRYSMGGVAGTYDVTELPSETGRILATEVTIDGATPLDLDARWGARHTVSGTLFVDGSAMPDAWHQSGASQDYVLYFDHAQPGYSTSSWQSWPPQTTSYVATTYAGTHDVRLEKSMFAFLARQVVVSGDTRLDLAVDRASVDCTAAIDGEPVSDPYELRLVDPISGVSESLELTSEDPLACDFRAWPGTYDIRYKNAEGVDLLLTTVTLPGPEALALDLPFDDLEGQILELDPRVDTKTMARSVVLLSETGTRLRGYLDDDGRFSLRGPAGRYGVSLQDQHGELLIDPGVAFPERDPAAFVASRCAVGGTVSNDGTGAPAVGSYGAASVQFIDEHQQRFRYPLEEGATDFNLALPLGSYDVFVSVPGQLDDPAAPRGFTHLRSGWAVTE